MDTAWSTVLREARSDDVPDVLRYEDLKLSWDERRASILSRVNEKSYHPRPAQVFEVPKDEFANRPSARLHPDDRVVYEAAVRRLRPLIESVLSSSVFSARYNGRGKRRLSGVKEWALFQQEGRSLYDKYDGAFMISTDVASYFEYVSIELLMRDLRALQADSTASDLISRLLNDNERTTPLVWGLPQGCEASTSLGNLYLQPIDALLQQDPHVTFVRYQDDIKIFSDSAPHLRSALRAAGRMMRQRHLNLSVHKTKLLEGEEILAEFEDSRKDAIEYGLHISRTDQSDELHTLFDEAVTKNPVNVRDVKFVIYRLSELGDVYAVRWIMNHLSEVPYLASRLVPYLHEHLDEMPDIEPRMRGFVTDPQQNLYPHSELHVLRMFAQADSIQEATYILIWELFWDSNRTMEVRQQAARCIGRHARPGAGQMLHDAFSNCADHDMARATLLAMAEAGYADKALLAQLSRSNPALSATCKYLNQVTAYPEP